MSLLAINAFVCRVVACLEVMNNRDYLVDSDTVQRFRWKLQSKWFVGVATNAATSPIELTETFAGKYHRGSV